MMFDCSSHSMNLNVSIICKVISVKLFTLYILEITSKLKLIPCEEKSNATFTSLTFISLKLYLKYLASALKDWASIILIRLLICSIFQQLFALYVESGLKI
jgi:hypothetical protein